MAEAVFSSLIDKLVVDLSKPIGNRAIRKSEIESLRVELALLNSSIEEADGTLEEEHSVKIWVKEMREVAELIEDVLDEYTHLTSPPRGVVDSFTRARRLTSTSSSPGNLASKINNIKALLLGIKERSERYNMRERVSRANADRYQYHQRFVSPSNEELLVGIHPEGRRLINWLLDSEVRRGVVAVLGTGGIGKTTLVKMVYEDEAVKERFDCCAWIAVPHGHNIDELLKLTAKQICAAASRNEREIDGMSAEELVGTLRKYLRSKRYLIVFDDVWREEFWHVMRDVLPDDKSRSRIIITTRSDTVAAACEESSFDHVHRIEPLSEEMSRELFNRIAFQREPVQRCPPELEQLCLEIIKICEGLPLAIVAIAGLLSTKEKVPWEWRKLLDNFSVEIESNARLTGLSKILALSFLDLPRHLKLCFLYFSIFPKEALIPNDKLFKLWIAEGFIQDETGKALEEVAEEHLNNLIKRNLVQECNGFYGLEKFSRVNSLMHEVARKVARERNFCQIWDGKESSFRGKSRRLLISGNTVEKVLETMEESQIRSVFLLNIGALNKSVLVRLFEKYRFLTLLDVENSSLDDLPREVGNLSFLKYLSLKNTKVKKLPKSISRLLNLQTLDLTNTWLVELPMEILKLENLRHLLASRSDSNISLASAKGVRVKEGIGRLANLQTLMIVDANLSGMDVIQELKKLRKLRRLSISRLSTELASALCACIEEMSHLESLSLYSMNGDESLDMQKISSPPRGLNRLILKGMLKGFPNWISSLQNLSVLCLSLSRLAEDPLQYISLLPKLESLWLYCAYEGHNLHFKVRGFEKLKLLVLREMYGLEVVDIEEGALRSLEELRIGPSPRLNGLPCGIQYLWSLKFLSFYDMPIEFVHSIQPDVDLGYEIIKHIPFVLFWFRVQGRRYVSYRLGESELLDHLQGLGSNTTGIAFQNDFRLSFSFSDDEGDSASTSGLRFDDISRSNSSGRLPASSQVLWSDDLSLSNSIIDRLSIFSDDIED